ncbi:MAG: hypothetical protein AAGJ82_07010 [Bacteroidota bacterium]
MTLVPNRLLRSNGNNSLLWLLLFCATLSLSACELFKPISQVTPKDKEEEKAKENLDPIQGRRVYDPATGTYVLVQNSPTDPMDTVRWRDIPSSVEPPIFSTNAPVLGGPTGGNPVRPIGTGQNNSQLLTSYNVAVVLPFLTDRYSTVDNTYSNNSTWAVQFYNGMNLAFDELEQQGVSLNVSLLDSKANEREVQNLTRTNRVLNDAHLILGPYLRSNASLLAEKARNAGSVLVSPHSASSSVSAQNPQYVQVNPTLATHCEAIMDHVLARYTRDQIVLVGMDTPSEVARFEYFQREYERLTNLNPDQGLGEPLKRLVVDTTQTDMQNIDFKQWFSLDRETVFIVPSWSQETFIYNFLRKLDLDRTEYERITVYGMPQWMDYERIDFDYYEKLNVHVSSSSFIDNFNPDVRAFKRRYYDAFGEIPGKEAYLGYDVTRYFGSMLKDHGTQFQYQLEANPADMLLSNYRFEPVINATTTGTEFAPVQRFENKYVHILQFKDYRFSRAN